MAAASNFAGRFHLGEPLGRGGMGAVYRAHDLTLGRDVALKLSHGPLDAIRLERFKREGQLTAALRHPGIVTVHAAGVDGGRPWIAYELIVGATSLATTLRAWPRERRVLAVRDAARALGHAHAQGVVHRDVKPDNLLVDAEGRVRVTDFGVATAADLEQLTRSGALVGTPDYMAPEQASGRAVSPATDVWALGVILYEALTGRLPFEGEQLFEVLVAIDAGRFLPPRAIDPSVPLALEDVCLRALEHDPRARHADGNAFADALERAVAGARSRRPRRPLRVLATLAALGATAGVVARSRHAPPAPAPAPVEVGPVVTASAPPPVDVVAAPAPPEPTLRPRSVEEITALEGSVRPLLQEILEQMPWADAESVEDADSGVALHAALELRNTDPARSARVFKWVTSRARDPSLVGKAWFELGLLFEEGLGVARHAPAAFACFDASAATGHAFGLVRVADGQLTGSGTAPDVVAAAATYRRALAARTADPQWVRDGASTGLAAIAYTRPDLASLEEVTPLLRAAAPRRPAAKLWLARLLAREGDRAGAELLLRELIAKFDQPDAHVRLALLLQPTDQEAARTLLLGPKGREERLDFARRLLEERATLPGALARAVEVLRELHATGSRSDRTSHGSALLLARLVRVERASGREPPISLAETTRLLRTAAEGDDAELAAEARDELARLER